MVTTRRMDYRAGGPNGNHWHPIDPPRAERSTPMKLGLREPPITRRNGGNYAGRRCGPRREFAAQGHAILFLKRAARRFADQGPSGSNSRRRGEQELPGRGAPTITIRGVSGNLAALRNQASRAHSVLARATYPRPRLRFLVFAMNPGAFMTRGFSLRGAGPAGKADRARLCQASACVRPVATARAATKPRRLRASVRRANARAAAGRDRSRSPH